MSPEERDWRDDQFGHWKNTGLILPDGTRDVEGYRCDLITYEKKWWLLPAKGIYDFRLNPKPDCALTYVLGEQPAAYLDVPIDSELQADAAFLTDKGSVPSFLHWAYERDRFLAWYPHDSMFINRHIWMKLPGGIWFKFPVNRKQADMIMFWGILSQDGSKLDAEFVYRAVHLFGRSTWNSHN